MELSFAVSATTRVAVGGVPIGTGAHSVAQGTTLIGRTGHTAKRADDATTTEWVKSTVESQRITVK